jgi:hypothetical protein
MSAFPKGAGRLAASSQRRLDRLIGDLLDSAPEYFPSQSELNTTARGRRASSESFLWNFSWEAQEQA